MWRPRPLSGGRDNHAGQVCSEEDEVIGDDADVVLISSDVDLVDHPSILACDQEHSATERARLQLHIEPFPPELDGLATIADDVCCHLFEVPMVVESAAHACIMTQLRSRLEVESSSG